MIAKSISAFALSLLVSLTSVAANAQEGRYILIANSAMATCIYDKLAIYLEYTKEGDHVHLVACNKQLGPVPLIPPPKPPPPKPHNPPYHWVRYGEPVADLLSKEGLKCALEIMDEEMKEDPRGVELDFSRCAR